MAHGIAVPTLGTDAPRTPPLTVPPVEPTGQPARIERHVTTVGGDVR